MNQTEYFEWAENNNFQSLECIYKEAMDSECDLTEYYETLTEEEANQIEIKDFTDLTLKYVKLGYLKINKVSDDYSTISIATNRPELTRMISPENIICIGDTIFQYTENSVKKIPNKNFSKISKLKTTEQTLADNSIIVENNSKNAGIVYFKGDLEHFIYITNSVQKTRAGYKIWFKQEYTSYPNFISYFATELIYEKYTWGKWRSKRNNFTFPATTYKLKMTHSNGTYSYSTESPWISYIGNTSQATKYFIHSGYGGNKNNFIHTPHIYNGLIKFIVQLFASMNAIYLKN